MALIRQVSATNLDSFKMNLDDKFYKLKSEVEKGLIRFIIKSILSMILALIIGRLIGTYYFGNDVANLWNGISSIILLFTLFIGIFSVITWHFKVLRIETAVERRENR